MREYVEKWDLIGVQLALMNALIDESLLFTMFIESIPHRAKSLFGSDFWPLFTKDDLSWQSESERWLQESASHQCSKVKG